MVNGIRGGNNINLHLDLIAGLPYEDYERFAVSFNEVYVMRANQFQLGFLKVLPGTVMHDKAESYGMVWSERAPYEIFRTRWITYQEISIRFISMQEVILWIQSAFFRKWMDDLTDRQAEDGKAHCIVPTVGNEFYLRQTDGCIGWQMSLF